MDKVIELSKSFTKYHAYIESIDTIDSQTMELIQQVYSLSTFEYSDGDCIETIENLIKNFHVWHTLER